MDRRLPIVVLGALGGIGSRVVEQAQHLGHQVVPYDAPQVARNQENVRGLDIRDPDAIAGLLAPARVPESSSGLLIINCIGAPAADQLTSCEQVSSSSAFAINFRFPETLTRSCIDASGQGAPPIRVVHIASRAASVGVANRYSYSVSKAALEALCRQVAVDTDPARFSLGAVSPSLVDTDFAAPILQPTDLDAWKTRRSGALSADSVAGLLLWLGLEGLPRLSGACMTLG